MLDPGQRCATLESSLGRRGDSVEIPGTESLAPETAISPPPHPLPKGIFLASSYYTFLGTGLVHIGMASGPGGGLCFARQVIQFGLDTAIFGGQNRKGQG